jgi:hypothetical protein
LCSAKGQPGSSNHQSVGFAAAAVNGLGLDAPPLALAGGLFATSSLLRAALLSQVHVQLGRVTYAAYFK